MKYRSMIRCLEQRPSPVSRMPTGWLSRSPIIRFCSRYGKPRKARSDWPFGRNQKHLTGLRQHLARQTQRDRAEAGQDIAVLARAVTGIERRAADRREIEMGQKAGEALAVVVHDMAEQATIDVLWRVHVVEEIPLSEREHDPVQDIGGIWRRQQDHAAGPKRSTAIPQQPDRVAVV